MVEMKVFGLAVDEDSQVPVLILKDLDEKRVLPIWIGAMEAMAISLALNEVKLPRPMTHDLLLTAFVELGSHIQAVEVTSLDEGTYYAEIEVRQQDVTRRIDSRPSDAIALALRAGVPIRVHEDVLEKAALPDSPDARPGLDSEEASKWNKLLEGFDPEDKYKM